MTLSPLGVVLRHCREQRKLSLREAGQIAEIDHAYIHRLETGAKEAPSAATVDKLFRVLKPQAREADLIRFLYKYPSGDADLVKYVIQNPGVQMEAFEAAYLMAHRGTGRLSPEMQIERAQRVLAAFAHE
ncbi:helix-turn-helix domain-containing protein [Aerolutibacter ruishenii]|uniref:Helix-turn-helix protein n=1 Tax=Aerolutibacter ruishenii TaxID=686800 RepID=A0A562LFJ5_9GAMM|nr:helix-turn-helix transcriptional regulator [Lysobacter ruishenii]TWI06376.1 helix-turn-helix protein [Lysobacter ruishenii]